MAFFVIFWRYFVFWNSWTADNWWTCHKFYAYSWWLVLLDLRVLNGRPESTQFDAFWEEVDKLVVENAAVQERRHGDCMYLPIAMSIEDLKNMVSHRLPEGTLIPSTEWIRLQFWPSNPYANIAIHHTGRFNLKYKVQSRLLRIAHEDCHYVAALYKYQKNMAVLLREHSMFVYVDDKANVPVGKSNAWTCIIYV